MNTRRSYFLPILFTSFLLVLWIISLHFFSLQKTKVLGTEHTSPEEVSLILEKYQGKALLELPKREVSHSLQALKWVKEVRLFSLFPHTLLINIKERTPLLAIPYQDALYLVDEEGMVIDRTREKGDLPLLCTDVVPIIGEKLGIPNFGGIVDCIKMMEESKGIRLKEIHFPVGGEFYIIINEGLKVIMGEPIKLRQKIGILEVILSRIPQIEKRVVYVNLSCPDAPAVKEREGS